VRVAQGAARFALFATAARDTVAIKDRLGTLQQPILKIIESAHARHVVRLKATQQRIKGLFPQARNPEIDGGDVALQHQQPGPQQIVRRTGGPPLIRHIQACQDWISRRKIGVAKLAP